MTTLRWWVTAPPSQEVQAALRRLARCDGVVAVAAMPDVHLARDVCVGTVLHTRRWLLPDAVGGDVGCGVSALKTTAMVHDVHRRADDLLAGLQREVPILASRRRGASLPEGGLSSAALRQHARGVGRRQLGSLGRGNHFVELQAGEDDGIWVVVHSGSRGVGPRVQDHHRARATRIRHGRAWVDGDSDAGRAYLSDLAWTRAYARANREEMLAAVCAVMHRLVGAEPTEERVECDHNHVVAHPVEGWIHRKGAVDARAGRAGWIPGSMGTASYRTVGRGCAEALWSSSHGAGRCLSRTEARRRLSASHVLRATEQVVLDRARAGAFVEEAPAAYRNIEAVMRAQRSLTAVAERLRPVLNHRAAAPRRPS